MTAATRPVLLTLALLAGALLGAPAAQDCALPSDTFWSNDDLPQSPGGILTVSVIAGLCEGEAAAQTFYLPGGTPPQKLKKVGVAFAANANGFVATANIEIYDGISWAGNTPTLGPKVFDYNADLGVSVQLQSTAILEVDLSPHDVVVGDGTDAFVVAVRVNINPNGSCAGGYTANLATDATLPLSCTTTPQTSLMDLQGQGWVDARTAQVSGFPLCPLFFNGNWVIRACTEDAQTNTGQFIDLGNNLTGSFAPMLSGDGSLAGGEIFTLSFSGQPINTTAFWLLDVVALFAPFKGGVLVPGTLVIVNFPTPAQVFVTTDIPLGLPPGVPPGTSLYTQAWYPDAGGPAGFSATNGLQLVTP